MRFLDRKIWSGGLASVAAYAIVWFLKSRYGIVLSEEMVTAFIITTFTSVAWAVPPSVQDIVKRVNGTIIDVIANSPNIPLEKTGDPPPRPVAKTTVLTPPNEGSSGRRTPYSIFLALLLILPMLGACGSTKVIESAAPAVTTAPITKAVQTVRDMPDEEKWRLACIGADGIYVGYVTMVAPKVSDAWNVKVQGGYEVVKVICANRPTNYAEGLVTLMKAIAAFNASIPAKAGA
ncbi:hypothetical protein [uncultured Alsobacter sp.]|uniref:hypothetical protein n=1 Tax=uncultured Alsobacter sp. TaxID=1748258 RepID=UPI0025DB672B|nr:hypothetical protein [uncultured Alsobacter sp.]